MLSTPLISSKNDAITFSKVFHLFHKMTTYPCVIAIRKSTLTSFGLAPNRRPSILSN